MFINPIKNGYMTSKFGWRKHPVTGQNQSFHQGVDIAKQPNNNVDVLAVADGVVIRTGLLSTYGNIVMIKHELKGKYYETNYAHLKDGSILVKVGDKVKQGQKIATMGNTGRSSGPHLHFEIHHGSWKVGQPNAVNPELYIKLYSKGAMDRMEKELKELKAIVNKQGEEIKQLKNQLINVAKHNTDPSPSSWATDGIAYLKAKGVTDGTRPKDLATRQEVMLLIKKGFENL